MTCKDCICSDVCYYKSFNDVRTLEKRRNDVERICKSFVHRDSLQNAPTVDAVPVVRCKDCKFIHEKGYCTLVTGMTRIEPDDYCSRGERRTDG